MARDSLDEDDRDEFEEDWPDDDNEAETVTCPHCRREIYEDAEQCPYCEQYLSSEDSPSQPKPWWIVVGILLCLIIVFFWVTGK